LLRYLTQPRGSMTAGWQPCGDHEPRNDSERKRET
jgi:hypothetical protein